MENDYLQQVSELNAKVLRQSIDLDDAETDLHDHLLKARQKNLYAYEAETLNTLGIVYALQGNVPQQLKYFNMALARTKEYNDINFRVKMINNLANSYLGIWELEKALRILEKGVEFIELEQINLIGSAYIYSGIVDVFIRKGAFDFAKNYFEKAQEFTEGFSANERTQVAYFQVVTNLDLFKIQLDIIDQNYETVEQDLNMIRDQLGEDGPDDLIEELDIRRLYQTVIIEQNQEKASKIHTRLRDNISTDRALSICHFFLHTKQNRWAHRYAAVALELAQSDNNAWPTLIRLTQRVYEMTSSTT